MVLGIRGIEESSVYQGIFAKGEARGEAKGKSQEARQILISLGGKKLGPPDEQVLARIAAISDLDRLNALIHRILDATSWDDLLASADQ